MSVSINGPGDLDLCPFDLETGVRVAPMVGNLHSKSGYARPLDSRIIRYVRDGRPAVGRTKATLSVPFPTGGGITNNSQLILCHIHHCHSVARCKRLSVLYSAPAAFFCDSVTIILTFIIITALT